MSYILHRLTFFTAIKNSCKLKQPLQGIQYNFLKKIIQNKNIQIETSNINE